MISIRHRPTQTHADGKSFGSDDLAEPNQRALRAALIHLQAASTQGNFLLYFDIKSFDHFIDPG
jgi:hypothetical protein